MATKTTFTRIGDLVIAHRVETPDEVAEKPAAPQTEEPKPKRGRKAKTEVVEEVAEEVAEEVTTSEESESQAV